MATTTTKKAATKSTPAKAERSETDGLKSTPIKRASTLLELLEGVKRIGNTTAIQALREAGYDVDQKPVKGQYDRAGLVDTEKAGLSGKARALWILTSDSAGNEAAKAAGKAAAEKEAPKVTATATAPAFEWPKEGAVKILLRYLKETTSDAADAPNKGVPFITDSGILRIKGKHWIEWLAANGMTPSKIEAGAPIRELGFSMKPFPIPGENRGEGFYTGNVSALDGADKLSVRHTQRGRTAAPKNPFTSWTDDQKATVTAALRAFKPNKRTDEGKAQSNTRDELLALLP